MLELKDFEAAYNKVQEVVLPTKLIKSDYFQIRQETMFI